MHIAHPRTRNRLLLDPYRERQLQQFARAHQIRAPCSCGELNTSAIPVPDMSDSGLRIGSRGGRCRAARSALRAIATDKHATAHEEACMPALHPRYPLGTTGITISPIGLGCWQFSRGKGLAGKMWPSLDDAAIAAVVNASLDYGVNWFDTAELYGWGESERALSAALSKRGVTPGDVVIATKWWPFPRTSRSLRKSIGSRLEALDGFGIDLYQIHNPAALATVG
ncbi:MAG: hypothetical protein GF331_06540, partial [Chitinivibrionales bacterium]|nr:hypothetical protein [Chitinivibrionales bacterium]